MTIDSGTASTIAEHIRLIVIFEWVGIVVFVAFAVVLGLMALKTMRNIQQLRHRRIQPLIDTSKAIARNGAKTAKSLADQGKSIFDVGMQTAEAVGLRAQTTAKVVQGAIPEARRLPSEVAATTADVREAVQTARTVRSAFKAVRGIRSIVHTAESARSLFVAASEIRRGLRQSTTHGR